MIFGGPRPDGRRSKAGRRQEKTAAQTVAEMRKAGLVEDVEGPGGESLVAMSQQGRRGIGPIIAAVRWERSWPIETPPLYAEDAVTFLLGPLPLVRLAAEANGTCALTITLDERAGSPRSATAWAQLREGRVVEYASGPPPRAPSASARGSEKEWFEALLDGASSLTLGGRRELAAALVEQMHAQLHGDGDGGDDDQRGPALQPARSRRSQPRHPVRPGPRAGVAALHFLAELGPGGQDIAMYVSENPGRSEAEIAAAFGLSPREVKRCLRRLAAIGAVSVQTTDAP
jgi:hypothetical protein